MSQEDTLVLKITHRGADLLAELERDRAALLTFYQMFLDIKANLDAGVEEFDMDPYLLQVAAILKGERAQAGQEGGSGA